MNRLISPYHDITIDSILERASRLERSRGIGRKAEFVRPEEERKRKSKHKERSQGAKNPEEKQLDLEA